MNKFSKRLMAYWLAIPRSLKRFVLAAFTICYFFYMIVRGTVILFKGQFTLFSLILCAITAGLILLIYHFSKKS